MNYQEFASARALTATDVLQNTEVDETYGISTTGLSRIVEGDSLRKIRDVSDKTFQLVPNFIDTLQPETSNANVSTRFSVTKLRDALHNYIYVIGTYPGLGGDAHTVSHVAVNDDVLGFTNSWEGIDSVFSEYPYSFGKSEITKSIREIIVEANNENFTNGIESNLIAGIDSLVQMHGNAVLEIIYDHTQNSGEIFFSVDVLVEIVQYLGKCDNASSESYRFLLLTRYLKHYSTLVRDAALIGLSYFDTPNVIPVLLSAIKVEKIQELKEDMESLLEDFEEDFKDELAGAKERLYWHIY